ncbi:MAG: hypothetical protein ATN34_04290 [Epulopiscium sp. Nele67-Bin002]|nr:MAG: hypothetical protein ATN34_04290 [Epulopiscium sp. Nele67-Bin002]OON91891.1 MAG: hypothetical protein ATN33_08370 [Epulopiscium sp. Nele67-Bin001]
MGNLLKRIFINQNESSQKIRLQSGYLGAAVGIVANIILFVVKFIIGTIAGSIAITADAINNLTDATSSIITIIGFKLSQKPADKQHPYGYARIENIAGLIIAILIVMIGAQLIKDSLTDIFSPNPVVITVFVYITLIFSILIKLWLYKFNLSLAIQINSPTLKATAKDSLNDVLVTGGILISLIITTVTGISLDGYIGMIVAVVIIITGLNLIKETSSPLLGESPPEELIQQIEAMILAHKQILGYHELMVHTYGQTHIFASVHVELDASMTIVEGHNLIDAIEKELLAELGINMVIHLDPIILI